MSSTANDAGPTVATGATPGAAADTPAQAAPLAVAEAVASAPPQPFLHTDSGAVRFWVPVPTGGLVGATVSKETLHYRFRAQINGSDAVASYQAHQAEIDDAVRRRVARGSIEPVMLREADLAPPKSPQA